jgi:hypothetical protein
VECASCLHRALHVGAAGRHQVPVGQLLEGDRAVAGGQHLLVLLAQARAVDLQVVLPQRLLLLLVLPLQVAQPGIELAVEGRLGLGGGGGAGQGGQRDGGQAGQHAGGLHRGLLRGWCCDGASIPGDVRDVL